MKSIAEDILLHIATDCWTSPNKLGFMLTTLHCIDRDWRLRQYTIGFRFLEGQAHNAIYLSNKLSERIRDFDITTRVLAIVSDNASVNTALARHLQANVFGQKWDAQQYRRPCLAYVIALVCNQFMKELKCSPDNDVTSSSPPAIDSSIKALQNCAHGTIARSVCKVS